MTGPARQAGDPVRRKGGEAKALSHVHDHPGVGDLAEGGVPALPGQERGRSGSRAPGRHVVVVEKVQSVKRGPRALRQRHHRLPGEGCDGLVDLHQVQARKTGGGPRVATLVPLRPIVVIGDRRSPELRPEPHKAGGGDGRVQSAGQLRQYGRMGRKHGLHGVVDNLPEHLAGPAGGIGRLAEAGRSPDGVSLDRITGEKQVAGRDRPQTCQGQCVIQQVDGAGDLAEDPPVDGDPGRQQAVQAVRRVVGDDRQVVPAPPDGVERSGRGAQQGEPSIVRRPGQDIVAPSPEDRAFGKTARRPAAPDHRGEGDIAPMPATRQDMIPMHLDQRRAAGGGRPGLQPGRHHPRLPARRREPRPGEAGHGVGGQPLPGVKQDVAGFAAGHVTMIGV